MPNALKAKIQSVTFFNTSHNFPDIPGYDGSQLYAKYELKGGTLSIVVDERPPSSLPLPLPNGPVTAALRVAFNGNYRDVPPQAIACNGRGLQVTATITPISEWDDARVNLVIKEAVDPSALTDSKIAVGYVIVQREDGSYELRWVQDPVTLDSGTKPLPTQARTIPSPPRSLGAGVSGPMGLETP